MTSNIYLASGDYEGVHVMKIGKANVIKYRQQQLDVRIDIHGQVDTHKLAHKYERRLRRSAKHMGAKRIANTHDYFVFDHSIYIELAYELVCCVSPLIIAMIHNSWYKSGRFDMVQHARWFDQYMDEYARLAKLYSPPLSFDKAS